MKNQIFLRSFQEKLLEDSTLTISFADFSENLIKNLSFFHRFLTSSWCCGKKEEVLVSAGS
ncbi:MAG: hypothetical protein L0207_00325 [Chlamydiae bacterium]|nr:hypothetical protein [Chlamydiota bacterium]